MLAVFLAWLDFLWQDRDCFGRQAKAQSVLALARDGQVFDQV